MEYTPITKKRFIYKKIFNNHVRESVVIPVAHFKKDPFNYYLHLTTAKSDYDVETPQTYKSVSIKCHTSPPLKSSLDRMRC